MTLSIRPAKPNDTELVFALICELADYENLQHEVDATPEEIAQAVSHGVVKMNLDSDAQYAYTRAVADHMFVNYAGVVRADCGIGDKRAYDPRTWGRSAEQAMASRVVEACHQVGSAGRSLTGHAPRPRRA